MASRDLGAAPQGEGEGPDTLTMLACDPSPNSEPQGLAHSHVAVTQGLDADEDTHSTPGPQPGPALQLPVVCGDSGRDGLQDTAPGETPSGCWEGGCEAPEHMSPSGAVASLKVPQHQVSTLEA